MQRIRIYKDGQLADGEIDISKLDDLSSMANTFAWLDLVDPSSHEIQELAGRLGLHELAVEDAIKGKQRPKLEHYDTHLFINVYAATINESTKELETHEISIFVTDHAIITVRDDEGFDINTLTQRWDDSHILAPNGISFLLWGLLDVIVDGYFDVINKLDTEVEDLEDLLFAANAVNNSIIQKRSYELRKSLVTLRRVAVPMREVLNPIVKRDAQVISGNMVAYYQDIYDHIMRVADWTDSLRDLVTTLLETNLTIQSNKMNLIMKKVTSWAAIVAVPTAITGWFGQNLPFFGFEQGYGVWISTGSIFIVSVTLWAAFKRNDWL
jgi:magnesium transporter